MTAPTPPLPRSRRNAIRRFDGLALAKAAWTGFLVIATWLVVLNLFVRFV